jgi:hypothetical protein
MSFTGILKEFRELAFIKKMLQSATHPATHLRDLTGVIRNNRNKKAAQFLEMSGLMTFRL